MAPEQNLGSLTEPARERPVAYDVDVVVAGSGLSGTFAAIAAAYLILVNLIAA